MDPASESNKGIFCRGVKADSQPCDCEEFFADSQDKGHCVECGHGCSKHPHNVSGYKVEDIQDEPQPSSSAAIKEIFNRVAGSRSVNEKSSTTKRGSLSLATAREEAILTLSSTRLASHSKLAKGPAPSAGLRKDRKETNPYPASQRNGLIRETKAPSRGSQNEIQAMRNHGCYLDQQFRVDSRWSYAKITNNLRTWFPKVFRYLDTQVEKRTSQPRPGQEEKPVWRLLNKSGVVLTGVDVAFPVGSDLAKHKGREKASPSECHLWFVTRNQIPDDVYESWNTQSVIAGSDSEHDGSDQLLSYTDSSAVDKSDNKLASSLMELDLTDAKVKDSDPKGKMKARSPKSTNHMKRVLSPDRSPSDTKQGAQKKVKKASDTNIPLFFMDSASLSPQALPSTQPAQFSSLSETVSFRNWVHVDAAASLRLKNEVSFPPEFVSVSEDDVLWCNRTNDNDPFAPERINPWDSCYIMFQNPANFLV
ncbi:uncharacterized protein F5147DRAFT_773256 [Suillus discolor]|uniref:Uncharacterized protein n=1 Tax=Suillus discolor TaxID=1912936 RepID=A0A9P7JU15_9AGAM|nr:uncharacterized protein F5147DRAFT_773256 [Suillus discolor]KAG2108925.1 hypothetical protein F5147DRAFT_773256 [Suillus discolor]